MGRDTGIIFRSHRPIMKEYLSDRSMSDDYQFSIG